MKPILEKLYPGVIDEYQFHPERRWRFDYAWPDVIINIWVVIGQKAKSLFQGKSAYLAGLYFMLRQLRSREAAVNFVAIGALGSL